MVKKKKVKNRALCFYSQALNVRNSTETIKIAATNWTSLRIVLHYQSYVKVFWNVQKQRIVWPNNAPFWYWFSNNFFTSKHAQIVRYLSNGQHIFSKRRRFPCVDQNGHSARGNDKTIGKCEQCVKNYNQNEQVTRTEPASMVEKIWQ